VEALRLLLADEGLRARMAASGAAYVRQNYARAAVSTAYRDFLEG